MTTITTTNTTTTTTPTTPTTTTTATLTTNDNCCCCCCYYYFPTDMENMPGASLRGGGLREAGIGECATQPLTARDRALGESLLRSSFMQEEAYAVWRYELQDQLRQGRKAEIEALHSHPSHGISYLTNRYLPLALQKRRWIA